MSCFLCGKHRQREVLKMRSLFGKHQSVCAPSCKELDESEVVRAVQLQAVAAIAPGCGGNSGTIPDLPNGVAGHSK